MTDSPLAEVVQVSLEVARLFDGLGIDWLVGGSLASSFHGIPRSTQDVDFVADLGLDELGAGIHETGRDGSGRGRRGRRRARPPEEAVVVPYAHERPLDDVVHLLDGLPVSGILDRRRAELRPVDLVSPEGVGLHHVERETQIPGRLEPEALGLGQVGVRAPDRDHREERPDDALSSHLECVDRSAPGVYPTGRVSRPIS